MRNLSSAELELRHGGEMSPKTKEWLEGFCLGISIGSLLLSGVTLSVRLAIGLGGIGVACDL